MNYPYGTPLIVNKNIASDLSEEIRNLEFISLGTKGEHTLVAISKASKDELLFLVNILESQNEDITFPLEIKTDNLSVNPEIIREKNLDLI